jgi:hypothetical protein
MFQVQVNGIISENELAIYKETFNIYRIEIFLKPHLLNHMNESGRYIIVQSD